MTAPGQPIGHQPTAHQPAGHLPDEAGTIIAFLAGTSSDGLTAAELITGGQTIDIILANDTWVAAGAAFDAERQNIIDGLDSDQSEVNGWNARIRDAEVVTAVARISDSTVRITLTAAPAYESDVNEVITVTIAASALVTSVAPLIAASTLLVSAGAALRHNDYLLRHNRVAMRHRDVSLKHNSTSHRHNG